MPTKFFEYTTVTPQMPRAISFTPSLGVTGILLTMAAGGGSGGRKSSSPANSDSAGGGGGGEWCNRVPMSVTPLVPIAGVVGAGGAGGALSGAGRGNDGTASSFGPYLCLPGFGGQNSQAAPASGTAGGGFGVPSPEGSNFSNTPGDPAGYEMQNWNYGASGGGGSNSLGRVGGVCEGHLGGLGGGSPGAAHGGGGAASHWGPGGDGGPSGGAGANAPAGSFGAGGGAPGGQPIGIGHASGAGGDGYILIEWEEP